MIPARLPLLALALGCLALSACDCTGGTATSNRKKTSSSSGSAGASGTSGSGSTGSASTGSSGGSTGSGHGQATALAVTPNPVTLDVVSGAGSVHLVATATYADGTSAPIAASWLFDRADLAHFDASGTLTAVGTRGGAGTATATYGGLSATASVRVVVHVVQNPAGATASDQAAFDSPDTTPSGTMLYPYDHTVFARGLQAPELMWSGGAAGDVYRVRFSEASYQATLFITADPPSDFPIFPEVWSGLTESSAGDEVTVEIARLSGGVAHAPMRETWTIANGSLRGSIYYWAVNEGQLMKITPGATAPQVVFDSGPNDQLGSPAPANYDGSTPPWSGNSSGKRCVACHTVSKDGSTAVAIFERHDVPTSPWGTIDLSATTPGVVQMSSYDRQAVFLGLSPDGHFAVENDADFSVHLYDARLGSQLASALDGITQAADPAFAPSGQALAYASSAVGSYPIEYSQANLDVIDFDPGSGSFTNRRTVVQGNGSAVAFPSFAPDSAWVFYQYGDYSRAKYGTSSVGHDDLYVSDVAGQAGPTLLGNASGAGLEARNQHIAYQPTVNPISVGGYSWVVFVSPRDYGNKMLSGADPTYENRKQLWVAAVDANPRPGADPSHPAFWLPGQDLTTINMSGYWALEACHDTGGTCTQGFECCSGYCDTSQAVGTCSPGPVGGGCSKVGDACTSDTSCCGTPAIGCVGGYCAIQPR